MIYPAADGNENTLLLTDSIGLPLTKDPRAIAHQKVQVEGSTAGLLAAGILLSKGCPVVEYFLESECCTVPELVNILTKVSRMLLTKAAIAIESKGGQSNGRHVARIVLLVGTHLDKSILVIFTYWTECIGPVLRDVVGGFSTMVALAAAFATSIDRCFVSKIRFLKTLHYTSSRYQGISCRQV